MLKRFANLIVSHRATVIVVTLLVTALLASQVGKIKIIVDPNAMMPQQHPYVIGTNMAERIFGANYTLVVAVLPKNGDIYRADVLDRVAQISAGLQQIQGVKKDTLISLSARRAKEISGTADGMEVRPLMEQVPQSPQEMARLKQAIQANPIYQNSIVAGDGRAAAIAVSVEKGGNGFRAKLSEVYKMIEPLKTAEIDIAVSGTPMFVNWLETYSQRIVWLFLIAFVLVGLLHYEAFRTAQGLILPLVTALLSVIWGLGLMGLAKVPMDAFNAATPILILAVTAGHAVQLLKRYYEEYDRLARNASDLAEASRQAVIASLVRVGPVMLSAGGVAAIGFLSLVSFDIDTVRNFGVFTGLGILSGLLIEMTFIPAVRASVRPPPVLAKDAEGKEAPATRIWDRIASGVAAAVVARSRAPIYVVAAVVAGIMAFGVSSLSLENSNKSMFSSSMWFQQDDQVINQRLGGSNTLYVIFEGESDDALKDPQVLQLMDDTQRFIETEAEVGKTMSMADLVKRMNQAMSGDDPAKYAIPQDRNLISQYLLLYSISGEPGDFDAYVDYEYRHANITAYLKKESSTYVHALINRISKFIDARAVPGIKVYYGGSVPQTSALAEVLVPGKLKNILQMSIVVFVVSALVFRSLVAGLLILVPLAVTVLANFGVMGMTGIPLNTPNSISSAMAIGIGADYAIYLLYRIKEEFAVRGDLKAAVRAALMTAGKAVLFVGSAIAGGYSVLLLSYGFNVHIWFGVLIVTSMLVSMIASLFLIPALVISLSARFVTGTASAPSQVPSSTAVGICAAAVLAGSLLLSAPARAEAPSVQEIMERNLVATKFDDSISEATIKLVNKNGGTRVRKTSAVTKLADNGVDYKRVTRFLSPGDIRNTVTLLVEHADADDEIWVYLPALKKVRRLASSNKKDSWVGTDLSYGDIIGYKVQDWNHKLLGQETTDGRLIYIVESTPKTPAVAAASGYSKRLNWIDSESFVAHKSEFYDVQGQLLKTSTISGVRKLDDKKNRWQPARVAIQQHQTGHQTIIEFDQFSANQGVGEEQFSTRSMEKEL